MTQNLYIWIARTIVLFTAMPIHECAHAFTAHKLGDNTARERGRLTLNPLVHLDVLGGLLLIFAGFGWAKPVPVDARRFKNPRRDMALTSLAGPLANWFFALLCMVAYKLLVQMWPAFRGSTAIPLLVEFIENMLMVNLYLVVFNLLPVPPLDGAKIYSALLPERFYFAIMRYERVIGMILFVLIMTNIISIPMQTLSMQLKQFLDFLTAPLGRLA